jgi:hypothetical protein
MPPTFETLTLAVEDRIATVSLNRPGKANAVIWAELQQCFEWLDDEGSVRVVIFAGNGGIFVRGWIAACSGTTAGYRILRQTLHGARRVLGAQFCGFRAILMPLKIVENPCWQLFTIRASAAV